MSRQEFEGLSAFAVLDTGPVFTSVADALREWVGILWLGRRHDDALTIIGDCAPAAVRGYSFEDERPSLEETRHYDAATIAHILNDAHYEIFEEDWHGEAEPEEA